MLNWPKIYVWLKKNLLKISDREIMGSTLLTNALLMLDIYFKTAFFCSLSLSVALHKLYRRINCDVMSNSLFGKQHFKSGVQRWRQLLRVPKFHN